METSQNGILLALNTLDGGREGENNLFRHRTVFFFCYIQFYTINKDVYVLIEVAVSSNSRMFIYLNSLV